MQRLAKYRNQFNAIWRRNVPPRGNARTLMSGQLAPGKCSTHAARSVAVVAVLRQSVIVPFGNGAAFDVGTGGVAFGGIGGGITVLIPPVLTVMLSSVLTACLLGQLAQGSKMTARQGCTPP
jgi:hypothetical protein